MRISYLDRQQCRPNRTDAGNTSKSPAHLVTPVELHELLVERSDLIIDASQLSRQSLHQLHCQIGNCRVGPNIRQQLPKPRKTFGRGKAELGRVTADRIGKLSASTDKLCSQLR